MKFFKRKSTTHGQCKPCTQTRGDKRGPPHQPTSKVVMDRLVHVRLRQAFENPETCAVCSQVYDVGSVITTLPCNHMFHSNCALNWLKQTCTCPVCRYKLPTDDENQYGNLQEEERMQNPNGHDGHRADDSDEEADDDDTTNQPDCDPLDPQEHNKFALIERALRFAS